MLLLVPGALLADPVDPADFTGSRNSGPGGGIEATGSWGDGGFVLGWMITDNMDGTFTYVYTISGPDGADLGDLLTHFILELSQGVDWTGVFDDAAGVGDIEIMTHLETEGNPFLPGPLYGVKLNYDGTGTVTLEFTTTQAPVWGNFYAKDGGGTDDGSIHAFNTGFLDDPAGCDPCTDWIARPDTITTTPTNTPTASPSATATATPTATPTATTTATATATPTATPTPTATATATPTPLSVPEIPTLGRSGLGLLMILFAGAGVILVLGRRRV